jgi:aminopeptidase N
MAPNLTHGEALTRFLQVSDLSYSLKMDVSRADYFSGTEEISFQWTGSETDLFLDFHQGVVQRVSVNGIEKSIRYDKVRLTLPADSFKVGMNKINIQFQRNYSTNGKGLTRFVDPVDQQVYLHTQFEAFDANRMFPCFDQPDLKARFTLTVLAPKDFQVVSATREQNIENQGELKLWSFPQSDRFSTYLFSLHAGPYFVWEDRTSEIPMRLFARKSLSQYIDAKEWFTFSKQGFAFYNHYFGVDYPFRKYDQLIVPAFNAGAMENVGAVTFAEFLVTRGKKNHEERRNLASIILHEMAHMWFGDFVTMKWWNDLWLNESFATYMSFLALSENTEFKEAWMNFSNQKSNSMWEDQLVTTHPIEAQIPDVLTGETSFDGITYGKGAATLQQLHYLLGDSDFQKGVADYFKTYAWSNTVRKDFIGSLAKASGRNLEAWQTEWLTSAGVNTVQAQYECEKGKLSRLEILQTPQEGIATLRSHALEIDLLQAKGRAVVIQKTMRAEISGPRTEVLQAVGMNCPFAVFPNGRDQGYVKVALDDQSLKNLRSGVWVQDNFLRKMLWSTYWQMVRDAKLSFVDYGDMALSALATEKDSSLRESLMSNLAGRSSSVLGYYHLSPLNRTSVQTKFVNALEELAYRRVLKADPSQKKIWFGFLVNATESAVGQEHLLQILQAKKSKPYRPDQDERWSLIRRLSMLGNSKADELMAQESKTDPSFNGKIGLITSQAAKPDWESKQKWIEEFKKPKSTYSFQELRNVSWSLFPVQQLEFREKYGEKFYQELTSLLDKKTTEELAMFADLTPHPCAAEGNEAVLNYLQSQKQDLDPMLTKKLRAFGDSSQKCTKIIKAANPPPKNLN